MKPRFAILTINFTPENRLMNIAALQAALLSVSGVVSEGTPHGKSILYSANISAILIDSDGNGKAEMSTAVKSPSADNAMFISYLVTMGYSVIDPVNDGAFSMNDVVKSVEKNLEKDRSRAKYIARINEIDEQIAALTKARRDLQNEMAG